MLPQIQLGSADFFDGFGACINDSERISHSMEEELLQISSYRMKEYAAGPWSWRRGFGEGQEL